MIKLLFGLLLSISFSHLVHAESDYDQTCKYSVSIESTQVNGSWDLDGKSEFISEVYGNDSNLSFVDNGVSHVFDLEIKRGMMKSVKNDSVRRLPISVDDNGDFWIRVKIFEINLGYFPLTMLIDTYKDLNINDLESVDENTKKFRVMNENGILRLLLHKEC